MELITINKLSFGYGKQQVIQQLDAAFVRGELSIILGRNGSGKSTLFQILSGVQNAYQGHVAINGIERKNIKRQRASDIRIGFMSQFHQTTFPFSVFDVVMTGRASFTRFAPRAEDRQRVEEVLQQFNLWSYKDRPYTQLSGGERQLVLLCRVLVQDPDIILLDEPTNHLDLHYQVKVLENLKRLAADGITIVCIMHDPNMAFLYGERLFLMQDKQLRSLSGLPVAEMHQLLENAYQVQLEAINHGDKNLIVPRISASHE